MPFRSMMFVPYCVYADLIREFPEVRVIEGDEFGFVHNGVNVIPDSKLPYDQGVFFNERGEMYEVIFEEG